MKKTIGIIAVALLCASFSISGMGIEKKNPKSCCGFVEWVQGWCQFYLDRKLLIAAFDLDTSSISYWIQKGANVNTKIPFSWVTEKEQDWFPRIAEYKSGITAQWQLYHTYKIEKGCTPLALVAARCGKDSKRKAAMKLLLKNGAQDWAGDGGEEHPTLWRAILDCDVALVKRLIELKAIDLPIDPYYLVTALGYSKERQERNDIIDMLLNNIDNPNGVGSDGNTTLHLAVKQMPELIPLLLKQSADVHAKNNKFSETPLHVAADYTKPKVMQTLLLHGARLWVQDEFGETPFHHLVCYGMDSEPFLLSGIRELFVTVHGNGGSLKEEWNKIRKRLFALFCYFNKPPKERKIKVPKDIRIMLADYLLCAETDTLVDQHINMLHKALSVVDNEGNTAQEIVIRRYKTSEIDSWFAPDPKKIKERFGPEIRERYRRVLKGLPQVELIN